MAGGGLFLMRMGSGYSAIYTGMATVNVRGDAFVKSAERPKNLKKCCWICTNV